MEKQSKQVINTSERRNSFVVTRTFVDKATKNRNQNKMKETEFVFDLVFMLFSFCIIYPPTEFESIGLTINDLFSSVLGSADIEFIQYQLKRTCLTFCVHTFLPLLYIVLYYLKFDSLIEYDGRLLLKFILWNSFVIFAFVLPVISLCIVYHWCKNDYFNHPLATNLRKYSREGWLQVAIDINTEYRRLVHTAINMFPH